MRLRVPLALLSACALLVTAARADNQRSLVDEVAKTPSAVSSLLAAQRRSQNPLIRFYDAPSQTHFCVIVPMIEQLSRNITAPAAPATEAADRTSSSK